jgi:hypothetical protein
VLAKNVVGNSAFSNIVKVVAALVPSKPPTPTQYTADTSQITIRWTAASPNGSAITKYNVYWDAGYGTTYTLLGNTNLLQY